MPLKYHRGAEVRGWFRWLGGCLEISLEQVKLNSEIGILIFVNVNLCYSGPHPSHKPNHFIIDFIIKQNLITTPQKEIKRKKRKEKPS